MPSLAFTGVSWATILYAVVGAVLGMGLVYTWVWLALRGRK